MVQNQLQPVTERLQIMARTENENWQLGKELLAGTVDELAKELVLEFNNPNFEEWYCGAIYSLGIARIHELRAKASKAKEPGRLFSFYVNQERKALKNKWRLAQMKKNHDG